MRAPIQVDDIDFSVIKKFPYASIELKKPFSDGCL